MEKLTALFSDDTLNKRPIIIAGPGSAENEGQVLRTAAELSDAGIKIFRAGVWKPRTKPGTFEGAGAVALKWLSKVKARTGMLTAVEVATRKHVLQAVNAGTDILWIGARTSANPFAVQEIADTLSILPSVQKESLTILVKNPINPDLELWIGSVQRIYNAGIYRIGAIHRGFSSYGAQLYRNPPQWRIPIELHHRYPTLPIICDPSHIGGKRELIHTLSQQALDMNFNGLIIESHCNPECALSDKDQQITPAELKEILGNLICRSSNFTTENLSLLRQQIDQIDDELLELFAKRMKVSREIGTYKKEHNMPIVQPERYNSLMQRRVQSAVQLGMSSDFMETVWAAIHEESVKQQIEL